MADLLEGKTAIVTGGGGGIGFGISQRFATEGARVLIAEIDQTRARRAERCISDAGGAAKSVVADVRDPDDVATLFEIAGEFGSVDVLVNNVGHYGSPDGAFHRQSRSEWTELYRVNLEHVLLCSQYAIRSMLEAQNPGSIVNVSTVEAFRGIPTRAVYSAFKAAVTGLTRSLAVEYGSKGIRVNAVAPDVTESLQVPYSRFLGPDDEQRIPSWVPVGRLGSPDDIAAVALFLASDLSAFVTGTTVHADGGTLAAGGWFPTEEGGWTNRPRTP